MKHGTRSAYNHHGCRCEPCCAAERAYKQDRSARLRGTTPPKHGSADSYNVYGCRCPSCRRAKLEANAAHIERVRERIAKA